MHREALDKFLARGGIATPSQLSAGQQAILRNGEPGTIERFLPNLNRVVVRTGGGLRTVRPAEIRTNPMAGRILRTPDETRLGRQGGEKNPVPRPNPGFAEARGMNWSHRKLGDDFAHYVTLNENAYKLVSYFLNDRFRGLSIDSDEATNLIANVRRVARTVASKYVRAKLNNLADTLQAANTKADGLSLIHETGEPADLDAIAEELFHAVAQRRPGKGDLLAGVPSFLTDHPALRHESKRIAAEVGHANPTVLIAELMHDIWHGQVTELSSEIQEDFAEQYYRALLEKHGLQPLEDIQELETYINALYNERRISFGGRDGPAQAALTRIVEEHKTGGRSKTVNKGVLPQSGRRKVKPRDPRQAKGPDK